MNRGYVGFSRSVRSEEAIASFEVPLSLISRDLVDDFLSKNRNDFSDEEYNFLKGVSVAKWKFVTKQYINPSSWHHTSSRFNCTDHYDLHMVARGILEQGEGLEGLYKAFKESEKPSDDVLFGVIKVQVWGGTRNYPKVVGHEVLAGIVEGDWLYYKEEQSLNGKVRKCNVTANKVVWLKRYDSYEVLVKSHKEFKSTKRVFNKLIKARGK